MAKQPPFNEWISIRHLQHFLARGQTAGLEGHDLLKTLGLSRSQLDDSEAALPVAALEPVLAYLARTFPDTPFGLHLARDVQPATFGVLGFLTQSAPRFADVLNLLVRYNGLLSSIGLFSLEHRPGQVYIRWACRSGGPLFRRHAQEYVLGSLVVLGRALLPSSIDFPITVHFSHAAPKTRKGRHQYHELFECPVHFEQPDASLIADSRLLNLPLRHSDPALSKALEPHANTLLRQRRRRNSRSDEVSRLINTLLNDHTPSVAEIAQQLSVSERTLHRELRHEGTRFRDVLDRVRFERARTLLRESNAPLDTLAARIGLQSRQSFIRWFRQHTGTTPDQYRKGLHND
ncbi:AraC family transcriptional regulator [Alloalcanivorax xenomutans]|uniref:AraC family transcriptional regulator n=1 Tax=Alloalcanivorax xenomutans TaxID=1094342 RepID=UPI0007A74EBD|nr:AraC family transcriptional regulator [Alloalcanivorax xenomutans]KYZ86663.1 hypothetical protein A3Q32_15310 [Alcanivorax sp. KX64203]ARB44785.1 hypothetical protein P40_04565 [Alloalcanivorax xenomutans]MCE7524265.1 AraC family transcriptional regulator [Alloalcanivorax xenomutans]WOA32405.1 AraC family transcriptional regulator [Alloalcanivorax xenomutans]WOD29368.1 AraC family transcriptional regulator [Alloalcanivorax xenomutans]